MWQEQDGCCAVCARALVRERRNIATVCIDHCHDSTAVRGLLCNNCNSAIGFFGEDPKVIEAALRYLTVRLTA